MRVNFVVIGVLTISVLAAGCGSGQYDVSPGEKARLAAIIPPGAAGTPIEIGNVSGNTSQTIASVTTATGGSWFMSADGAGDGGTSTGTFTLVPSAAAVLNGVIANSGGGWGGAATLGFNFKSSTTTPYDATQGGSYNAVRVKVSLLAATAVNVYLRMNDDYGVNAGGGHCAGSAFGKAITVARTGEFAEIVANFADLAPAGWDGCAAATFDPANAIHFKLILDNTDTSNDQPYVLSIKSVELIAN